MEEKVGREIAKILPISRETPKDLSFAGQAKKLYGLLKCPKKYILFTCQGGAEDHCHVAALSLANQLIFDWLDNTLREQRS